MTPLQRRLQRILDERFAGNRSDLARFLETTPSTVNDWFWADRVPGGRYWMRLARVQLHGRPLNLTWLATGQGEMWLGSDFEDGVEYARSLLQRPLNST